MPASALLREKLTQANLSAIATVGRWRERWELAKTREEHISLLYWGLRLFQKDEQSFLDQVCFYFEVADGYRLERPTKEEEESIIPVAQTAWKQLCLYLFHSKLEEHYLRTPKDVPVVEKLIWFFDPERNNNIPDSIDDFSKDVRFIGGFVWRNLYWLAWRGSVDSRSIREEHRAALAPTFDRLHALRPKLLPRLLQEPDGLETLLNLPARADTLAYLRERALEARWVTIDSVGTQREYGPYASLGEAIRAGRRVAEVCLILEHRLKAGSS